ncbi:outer membrane beta-barrel protein [Coprobacter tertius]|uniref:Porin family protein n=1 Tax=Coprobacter tertius TaxID=2944915 RepID=A0ABT1ME72_9BACT|nr:outer membrane beta-barrel protein [Coprobacter tertius]MCP9610917.1 porin family protein [Coprobacter tertius]
MKSIKNICTKVVLATAFCLAALPFGVNAQNANNGYAHVDWQFNAPLSNKFSDKASGWGMNFEGGYYVLPNFGIGAFISFHTNNEYIPTRTIQLNDHSAATMDQQHSVFQLPFGAAFRYRFLPETYVVEPYIGLKMGAEYARMSTYYNVYKMKDDSWGFTVSPEVGMSIFPTPDKSFGFHVALYYSYATNKSDVLIYNLDGLNNIGFRLGVTF